MWKWIWATETKHWLSVLHSVSQLEAFTVILLGCDVIFSIQCYREDREHDTAQFTYTQQQLHNHTNTHTYTAALSPAGPLCSSLTNITPLLQALLMEQKCCYFQYTTFWRRKSAWHSTLYVHKKAITHTNTHIHSTPLLLTLDRGQKGGKKA